jgi:hypothetical protein
MALNAFHHLQNIVFERKKKGTNKGRRKEVEQVKNSSISLNPFYIGQKYW